MWWLGEGQWGWGVAPATRDTLPAQPSYVGKLHLRTVNHWQGVCSITQGWVTRSLSECYGMRDGMTQQIGASRVAIARQSVMLGCGDEVVGCGESGTSGGLVTLQGVWCGGEGRVAMCQRHGTVWDQAACGGFGVEKMLCTQWRVFNPPWGKPKPHPKSTPISQQSRGAGTILVFYFHLDHYSALLLSTHLSSAHVIGKRAFFTKKSCQNPNSTRVLVIWVDTGNPLQAIAVC